jgi:hypothetical protein
MPSRLSDPPDYAHPCRFYEGKVRIRISAGPLAADNSPPLCKF